MAKTEANWVNIDPATLTDELQAKYQAYKEAYRFMKSEREAFEEAMAKAGEVAEGKRMVFGYNFGKLSVALVDDDRKPSKPKASQMTLAQFMAQANASGHRA